MHGTLILRPVYYPALAIGDTQLVYVDSEACKVFRRHPDQLTGAYMSDLQPGDWREVGQINYGLRCLGHAVPAEYCTVILGADGEVLPQVRELVGHYRGVGGENAYMMRCTPTREAGHLTIPDLTVYGVTRHDLEPFTGLRTVRQLREQLATKNFCLPHDETFVTIVEECDELVKQNVVPGYADGLALALSPHVTWCLHAPSAHTTVFVRQTRAACGRSWDGRRVPARECPSCHRRL